MGFKPFVSCVLALSSCVLSFGAMEAQANDREVAYKKAKETMSPDLYLIYRVADRLITANDIKRPVRVAVRRNVDCSGMLGIAPDSSKCQSIQLLPEIDQATNFDIWAAQVVGTMKGDAGAFAIGSSGTIFLNTAMLKELTGKIDQVACVIGHELAHVTQNHSADKQKKLSELDSKTGDLVASSVSSARTNQNIYIASLAILGGINAGLGNSTYSTDAAIQNLQISAMLTRPEVAKTALDYTPKISEAINGMQGLAANFAAQAWERIQYRLRDHALEFAGFSRSLEYEADLLGAEYVVSAGFNPGECIKMWTETMNHDEGKIIKRLLPEGVADPGVATGSRGEYSGMSLEEIRRSVMDKTKNNSQYEKEKKAEPDYKKIPEDVMNSLKSTHPDGLSRAAAIDEHLAQKAKISGLKQAGQQRLVGTRIRNWSYDKQSDSVVISDSFVDPRQAGSNESGTTGIDVDKSLGF